MKKFFFRPLILAMLAIGMSVPVLADTIRLKDGSVIRGQIVSFKNEQFTIMVGSGARGRKRPMRSSGHYTNGMSNWGGYCNEQGRLVWSWRRSAGKPNSVNV